ncbi:MAG: aldo/keto reductase [Chloroflexi bacterium]|nr:MAG: aldo/keto reductase [Chloroflexota bacterium]
MQYRKLGQTDIDISVVSMGCWQIVGGDWWGAQDEADSLAAIDAALDVGINFFDTAEGYGAGGSEEVLGKALEARRDKAIVATKVSRANLAADDLRAACERSLRRLRTDYIDFYQIHWPSRDVPFEESMTVLQELKQQGKVRAIGVSNFGPQDMIDMLALGRYEGNQIPYNLLWRSPEYEIQPICVEHNISILPYSPLNQGLLTGKFASADEVPDSRARTRQFASDRADAGHGEPGCEEAMFAAIDELRTISDELERPMAHIALAWLLHQPAVDSVIAGARNPQQVIENAAAADLTLSDDMLKRLDEITAPVKTHLGSNVDMWASESRYR